MLLALMLTSGLQAQESQPQGGGERDNFFRVESWSGYNLVTQLKDDTSLFSYIAEVPNFPVEGSERAEHNAILRITFMARFQCSPLIELIGTMPEDTNDETRVEVLRNFNRLALSIDDEELDFPVFVEQQNKNVHSFYNANLEGRATMKIYIEIGDHAIITYGDGTKVEFSLIGSRNAVAQALGRCRSHQ